MKKPKIGIIGAGKLGTAIGQLAVNAGYEVGISASGAVEKIELIIQVLVPGAKAYVTEDLVKNSDIVILAIPLSKYKKIDSNLLKEKIVIDAMNYWWEVDGSDEVFSDENLSSSERVQNYFEKSYVVKTLNHIGYHDLVDDARQKTKEDRKAMVIATDHDDKLPIIEKFIDDIGYDPLHIGNLRIGRCAETGQPLFGASLSFVDVKKLLKK